MKNALLIISFLALLMLMSANPVNALYVKQFDFINNNANGTDTQLASSAPVTNYGDSTNVYAGGTESLVMLNLSYLLKGSIPSGSTIDTMIVSIYLNNDVTNLPNIQFYPLAISWEELIVTWNNYNNGGVDGTDYNASWKLMQSYTPAILNQFNNFTINKTYAQEFFDGTLGIWDEGIMIRKFQATTDMVGIVTTDHATTANRMVIYINYTFAGGVPPEINSYDMTSAIGGSCANWNTNKENACETTDTTPTVAITTNENANCAIGISDYNYTDLGINRTCSGSGTQQHTCTLIPQDALTQENPYLYIGCQNIVGRENRTSTSGALKVTLSSNDAENSARTAIEAGVQRALAGGYTTYTSQKLYERNSANQQMMGTFDKVVKWLNKVWAFNYLTGNQTSVGMFNITPVLYVWEGTNMTFSQINNTVYNTIMSTK